MNSKKDKKMDRDLIYIAGFFDGEGCVSTNSDWRVVVVISQKDPAILEWIRDRLGYGNLTKKGRNDRGYSLRIVANRSIIDFAHLIGPHCRLKRRQLELAAQALFLPKTQRLPLLRAIDAEKVGSRGNLRKFHHL